MIPFFINIDYIGPNLKPAGMRKMMKAFNGRMHAYEEA